MTPASAAASEIACVCETPASGPRRIGYARVSTIEQNLDLQRDALRAAGVTELREERASGRRRESPGARRVAPRAPRRRRPGVLDSIASAGRPATCLRSSKTSTVATSAWSRRRSRSTRRPGWAGSSLPCSPQLPSSRPKQSGSACAPASTPRVGAGSPSVPRTK